MINGGEINGFAINDTQVPIPPTIVISRRHVTNWTTPLSHKHVDHALYIARRLHSAPYALLAPVSTRHATSYTLETYDAIEAGFDHALGFSVEQQLAINLPLQVTIETSTSLSAPLNNDVETSIALVSELLALDSIEAVLTYVVPLIDESITVVGGDVSLTKDGSKIELAPTTSLGLEEGDHAWKGNLVLANPADASLFAYNDALVLNFYGVDYHLLVDTKTVNRAGPGSTAVSIGVIGPAAIYSEPRAQLLTTSYPTAQSARAIVEGLIGAVDWRIDDWTIPANRLGAEDATPMDTAVRIAEATGAVIEANPDGSLYVRYRYEVPLSQYEATAPDHVFHETDSVFSRDEAYQFFVLADRLRITDIDDAAFGDRIEFIANEDDGLNGQLHVYPSPWRDVTLQHTGPAAIGLTPQGDVALEKTEQIEIIGGVGRLNYPIQSINSIEWEVVDLGALVFTPGSTTVTSTSNTKFESLVTVNYTALAKVWNTGSPVEDVVQFVLG